MTDFAGVVKAWDEADPYRIHPARQHESEDAYWASGRAQALEMAPWIPEGGTVLDFGCGDGRLAIPLAKLGFHVWAFDASAAMLARLRQNVHKADISISTMLTDGLDGHLVQRYGQNGGMFHAVAARAVFIHHSHTDVIALVKNLTKTLLPGGVLIADWPTGRHHERRDWIDVTTWEPDHRAAVAESVGLTLVQDGEPSVFRKG